MKTRILIFLIALSYSVCAQKSLFVRVYDLKEHKIHKGNVYAVTDSTLMLEGGNEPITIPVSGIGFIRTKHSAGHTLLIGSLIGVIPFAIIGAASANSDSYILNYTPGEGAAGGALIGLGLGAVISGIGLLAKHSIKFSIRGDFNKWKVFQSFAKHAGIQ